MTLDSPIDLAKCARNELVRLSSKYQNQNVSVIAYIASDNLDSSKQIMEHLTWNKYVYPKSVCHIDLQKALDCTISTLAQWFLLSLSDVIVTQSIIKTQISAIYLDSADISYFQPATEYNAPVSAFSRFASTYGLSTNEIKYSNCTAIDINAISHYTNGNWICSPKQFY